MLFGFVRGRTSGPAYSIAVSSSGVNHSAGLRSEIRGPHVVRALREAPLYFRAKRGDPPEADVVSLVRWGRKKRKELEMIYYIDFKMEVY